jgi:hypothetical protein
VVEVGRLTTVGTGKRSCESMAVERQPGADTTAYKPRRKFLLAWSSPAESPEAGAPGHLVVFCY